uniref:Uncharacterized protein n=1 Tax=Arundo donax TaxID=35708 RepID=A0A0A9DSW2_ARUDO
MYRRKFLVFQSFLQFNSALVLMLLHFVGALSFRSILLFG